MKKIYLLFVIVSVMAVTSFFAFKKSVEKETIFLIVDKQIDEELQIVIYHPVYWALKEHYNVEVITDTSKITKDCVVVYFKTFN